MALSVKEQHHESQTRELIIGGHDIQRGRYPYFVSIDKNFGGVVVNGVLIAPDIVLTAGHIALDHMDNLTLTVSAWSVVSTESDDAPHAGTIISVEEYVVHPKWDQFAPLYFAHDFMILKLAEPSTVQPIRIDRRGPVPVGEECIMMGLGWTDPLVLSPAHIVQETTLTIISNAECESAHDPARNLSYQGLIVPTMMCTIAPPNMTRDGCAWDSGAPLIFPGATANDDVLIALGSTGIGCADPYFPGIQARVSADLDWIDSQVCQFSHYPPIDFNCSRPSSRVFTPPASTGSTVTTTNGLMMETDLGGGGDRPTTVMFRDGCVRRFAISSYYLSGVLRGAAIVVLSVIIMTIRQAYRRSRRNDYVQL